MSPRRIHRELVAGRVGEPERPADPHSEVDRSPERFLDGNVSALLDLREVRLDTAQLLPQVSVRSLDRHVSKGFDDGFPRHSPTLDVDVGDAFALPYGSEDRFPRAVRLLPSDLDRQSRLLVHRRASSPDASRTSHPIDRLVTVRLSFRESEGVRHRATNNNSPSESPRNRHLFSRMNHLRTGRDLETGPAVSQSRTGGKTCTRSGP